MTNLYQKQKNKREVEFNNRTIPTDNSFSVLTASIRKILKIENERINMYLTKNPKLYFIFAILIGFVAGSSMMHAIQRN